MPDYPVTITGEPKPKTYQITYELDGGTAENPTEYTIESNDIKLKNPVKGDKFESGILQYQVTKSDANNGTAAVVKLLTKSRKVIIPAVVEKNGNTFKVTETDKLVFQKNNQLKKFRKTMKSAGKKITIKKNKKERNLFYLK